ncbi:hypothetical protein DM02DRAFT_601784 [Periconia macrospinosa]|uniref:SnoaL-like domain-containing protein n=1 Tax=Periconia macrospinosa TaxID=97972 RepID=A0A2V1D9V0_9PLEO|nr:hypothetical protein DM02DRAFT_601784 [Periconia macrospinosa]
MSGSALPSGISTGMSPTDEATSRTLILSLIYRYASLAREEFDDGQITELFEADGIVQFPDGRELSPSRLGEITGTNPPKYLRHHLTTVDIQFLPDHWGRWDDVVKRQSNGRWLFKKKAIIVDGLDPNGWLITALGPAEATSDK